jgi:hypothetical protein
MRGERGGIITGFFFRMILMFAILGLAVFEAGAIIVTHVAVDGIATDAAREAAVTYDRSAGSIRLARAECERLAERASAVCVKLTVADGAVRALVRKEASTLIIHRIGPLQRFTVAEANHFAPIP